MTECTAEGDGCFCGLPSPADEESACFPDQKMENSVIGGRNRSPEVRLPAIIVGLVLGQDAGLE